MLAAHEWNRAERAAVIAAFADLEVAHVRQSAGEHSHAGVHRRHIVGRQESALLELWNESIHFRRTEEEIDLGQRVDQLVLVPLDHTPDANDRFAASVFLEPTRFAA